MSTDELLRRLVAEGVPPGLYDLSGTDEEDRLCLTKTRTAWQVYYVERGKKWDVQRFSSESETCECFSQRIQQIMRAMSPSL